MRCWVFLEQKLKRPVTPEDCPYAPCDRCNYRLGWEIGLITETMFPEVPDPTPESLLPSEDQSESERVAEEVLQSQQSEAAPHSTIAPSPDTPAEKSCVPGEDTDVASDITTGLEMPADIEQAISEADKSIGQQGFRFCHELIDCPNPDCPVRQQQIIQCFRFFSRRSAEEKQKITCSSRTCAECFVKKGWDIGVLHEGLFEDIIEKKKLKIVTSDRIKRNTLVDIYLSELAKKPLSRKEELELAKKIAGDRDASEVFLMANLKLVLRIAKKFSGGSLGIMDLIQEGNIGLIKAIAKFDYTLGYRFSTYAAYWIRYYMQKAVANQGSALKIPHHLLTVAHKLRRQIQEFENQFQRPPSLKELAKLSGLDEEKILSVLNITQTPVSIYAKTGDDDEEGALEYYLADRKNLTPEEQAFENLKNEAVQKAIGELPERLHYIVNHFYGFSQEQLSLAEIGRRLDISRERCRQLLHQALQLLQQHELIANLKPEP
jgi:RNA polymerase primary sigma factor